MQPTHSSINLTNRSITPHKATIDVMTRECYSKTCNRLQKTIQDLYDQLYSKRYDGLSVSYVVTNEAGYWQEQISLKEYCHGTPYLTLTMDTCSVDPNRKTEYEPVDPADVAEWLGEYFEDEEFCHIQLMETMLGFLTHCAQLLEDTHDIEIEGQEGVFYFKATPRGGDGVISVICRSQEAVVSNDAESLSQLHLMGYRADFERVVRH